MQHPAVGMINLYQRFLSPHKGFCCAHRVATGGVSCSQFAKLSIIDKGFWAALSDIRQRLQDCKTAAIMLNQQKETSDSTQEQQDEHPVSDCFKYQCGSCAIDGACQSATVAIPRLSVVNHCGDACVCWPF